MRIGRLSRLSEWLVGIALAASLFGCMPDRATSDSPTLPNAGGAPPWDGGPPDAGPDASDDGGPGPDAAVAPVLIGLHANPSSADGGVPSLAQTTQAELMAFAIGVRAMVVPFAWKDATAEGLQKLETALASLHARNLSVVLELDVVDRLTDGRPDQLLALPWDAPATTAAMQSLLDELEQKAGANIQVVVFGRETDRYATKHPAETTALTQFLALSIAHVSSVGQSAPLCGVGLSFAGPTPPATYQALLGLGSVAVISYFPGLGSSTLEPAAGVIDDLDAMITLAAARPLILESVGYSSAATLGSSADQQRQFFDGLFGAVDARRRFVPIVSVDELHDRVGLECTTDVQARGEPASGSYAQYVCALGLRNADGTAKPAWQRFVQGAAAFASP